MERPPTCDSTDELYDRLFPLTEGDQENDWHLLLYLNAICCVLIEDAWSLITDRDDMTGWAVLLNADLCPAPALQFLSQFVGVKYKPQMTEADLRNAIKVPTGFQRGGKDAIIATAQRFLTGTMHVYIKERLFDGGATAWGLTVRTRTSQTPDPEAVRSAITLEQKPGGIRLDYDTVEALTYTEAAALFTDYDEAEAFFDTYDEAATYIP